MSVAARAARDASAPGADLVEGVRALTGFIAERDAETERARRNLNEVVEAVRQTGFLRAYVPSAFGGLGLDVAPVLQSTRLMAAASPATAWAMSVIAGHAFGVALMSPQVQEEVWVTGPDTLIASSLAPSGSARRVDGGAVVNGRYSWSSGSEHCGWAMIGMRLPVDGGETQTVFGIVPRDHYTIDDVWDSAGLRGTGSNDLVFEEVFIPDYRMETSAAMSQGRSRGFGVHPEPVYNLPAITVMGAGFSAVCLGGAEGLRESYRDRLSTRIRAHTGLQVRMSPPAYMRLAESTQDIAAVGLVLERDWGEMATRARSGARPTPEEFIRWRTDTAWATRASVRAADRLFEASGGSVHYSTHAMQRLWRDIHTAAGHIYNDYDMASQAYGRHLLGMEPDPMVM